MSLQTTYPFITPANYTYDTNAVLVDGGAATVKNPSFPATFAATYTSSINGVWGEGVLVGTSVGGAALTGTRLDLSGGAVKYVDYPAADNSPIGPTGAIKLKYTPDYTGGPAATVGIVSSVKDGSALDAVYLWHRTNGNLEFYIRGFNSILIVSISTPVPMVSGTTYEIEVNWDVAAGGSRIFVDGVQKGSTNSTTGTRALTATSLRVGNDYTGTKISDAFIEDVLCFQEPQHTSNYTPGYTVGETPYPVTSPTIEPNSGITADALDDFMDTTTLSGTDAVQYALRFNGALTYFDGAAWVVSDGTYAQTNSAAVIAANKATLDLSIGGTLSILIFLSVGDGTTTPALEELSLCTSFFNAGSEPAKCMIYGEILDNCCHPMVGASIKVDSDDYFYDTALIGGSCSTVTDDEGKWELSVVETVTDSKTVTVTITYFDEEGEEVVLTYDNIIIPNQNSASLVSLIP